MPYRNAPLADLAVAIVEYHLLSGVHYCSQPAGVLLLLYQHEDQRVNFNLKLVDGPRGLSADSGQIRQLLHNLVVNSSEAVSEAQQAAVTIRTRRITQAGKKWLELEVSDRGPGYPAAVLQKPFEPYVTFKANGSGLGLAIVRDLTERMDGSVTARRSTLGGAELVVSFPPVQQPER